MYYPVHTIGPTVSITNVIMMLLYIVIREASVYIGVNMEGKKCGTLDFRLRGRRLTRICTQKYTHFCTKWRYVELHNHISINFFVARCRKHWWSAFWAFSHSFCPQICSCRWKWSRFSENLIFSKIKLKCGTFSQKCGKKSEMRDFRLACRHLGFDRQNRHVILGVKTLLSTLETVCLLWDVVAQWLECRFKTWASSFTSPPPPLHVPFGSDETLLAVGPFYLVPMQWELL